MHGGAKRHLDRLQIRAADLLSLGEDAAQERSYFTRDFCLDRRSRFFSSDVSASSIGRKAQILSLISTISAHSF